MAGNLKTYSSWDNFQLKIQTYIEKKGINRFRFSHTVIQTMDPPLPFLFKDVINLNDIDKKYLKQISRNFFQVGGGYRGTIFPHCSDSRVQKILTLLDLKNELSKVLPLKSKSTQLEFVEFGGGIGEMAELIISELNPNSYKIIDVPIVQSISSFYLNHQNLKTKVDYINLEQLHRMNNQTYKVFISSWAISECNLSTRHQIEKIMSQVDFIFLEMQDYFDGIDNYGWITEFLIKNPNFEYESLRSTRAKRSRLYLIRRVCE